MQVFFKMLRSCVLIIFCFSLTGCETLGVGWATRVKGESCTQKVKITSCPLDAKAKVFLADKQLFECQTPCIVELQTCNIVEEVLWPLDSNLSPSYVIKIEKEGYKSVEAIIKKSISGWYHLNLFLPVPIISWPYGILKDQMSGAKWTLRPGKLRVVLDKNKAF